ncbi:LexA family transcriptional regulator [Alcaligenes endophyticus]|uniref:HTH cro/C1-type domain-containing protein n=1 Tax=Alcaligenes endophyticus TaxID=1929088 RepID=A0ABT8ENI0_9BURK|nr:S24 family peptidase [Alcaligenes endophyticus]MCX5592851.1 hypothetical protein [Alcaligenes endophyticus]MDN4122858.1 hypothetical protein [Alcaligenes endophyticus]
MKNLSERIQQVKDETGWSNAELARRSGTSRAAPTDWLNGKVRVLSAETAQQLSDNSEFSAAWLATGSGPSKKDKHVDSEATYVGKAPKRTLIPVLGVAQLGENGWYEEVQCIGSEGYIEHFSNDVDAYVLRVKGDSMFPAIRNNWYVVVEPNAPIVLGEYVAIRQIDGKKMVKELLNRNSEEVSLMSVNGGSRLTLPIERVAEIHAVAAVVSPSKHKDL